MTPIRLAIRSLIAITLLVFSNDALADRNGPLRGSRPDRLLELARKHPSIQVIVGVQLEERWSPAAELIPERAARQRQKVKERKRTLLRDHPRARLVESRDYQSVPYLVLEVDEPALRGLLADESVASIEENAAGELTLDGSSDIVGATAAQGRGYGGAGQVIVIIDTGVDSAHPFFRGRIIAAAEACFSGFERAATVCPNGTDRQLGPGAARPCSIVDSNPFYCDHGTHVAGIAAGRDAGRGFSGIAPDAMIIPIQVASWEACSQPRQCGATVRKGDVLAALDHVVTLADQYSIAAVNTSLSFPPLQTSRPACDADAPSFRDFISLLREKGVAVVAGAGNDSTTGALGSPACISGAIAVGATTDADRVASYSNNAPFLDLLAPGGDTTEGGKIWSSIPGGGYREQSGTSMAAPHVAGAFAVLKQRSPGAPVDTLQDHLVQTGTPVKDTRFDPPLDPPLVKPRIDIEAALDRADSTPPSAPGWFEATGSSTGGTALTWAGSTDNVGIDRYELRRRGSRAESWSPVAVTGATSYTDMSVAASRMFQYEIVAVDTSGLRSEPVRDSAVTVTFTEDPIGNSVIFGRHIGQLREAADAWREFAGLPRAYASYVPQTGGVLAAHFVGSGGLGIVDAWNAARSALDLPPFTYVGVSSPAPGGVISRQHVQQVRDAIE